MWFWRKKKGKVKKPLSDLRIISLQMEYRITRLDYMEAYLKALLKLHPEVKDHPAVLDLAVRRAKYQNAERLIK